LLRNTKGETLEQRRLEFFLPINTYETGNMLEKEGQINPKN